MVSLLGQIFAGFLMLTAVVTMVARRQREHTNCPTVGDGRMAASSAMRSRHSSNHPLAYYSSVARAWEVLAGVLAAGEP